MLENVSADFFHELGYFCIDNNCAVIWMINGNNL